MNEIYQNEHEQQEKLSNQSTTKMATLYSSPRNSPLSNQQLTNHDNENEVDKETSAAQGVQHWKLDHENSSNDDVSPSFIDQLSSTSNSTITNLSNEISSNHTDKNSNKAELSTIPDESEKSLLTMKKRVTPIPASYVRRRPSLENGLILNDSSNSNLLLPQNKNKLGGTGSIVKKSTKSVPIFIEPKRSSSHPPSFSSLSRDDALQIKRKPILERQTAIGDDLNTSSMTNWAPAPPIASARFYIQSSGSSVDDDSDEESDYESLLIRKKKSKIKNPKFNSSLPTSTNIPSAIFITDPYGQSHTFGPDDDIRDNNDQNEDNSDSNSNSNDTNTLFPDSTFDISSIPELVIIPPTPIMTVDKHILHSIGEEEEEEEEEDDDKDDHHDNNIFSKELNHVQTKTRTQQTNSNIQENNSNQLQQEIDKEPLDRRWSDGVVDEGKEQIPSSHPLLIKMSSAASVVKPTENPPVKLSIKKYLLMKLHLKSPSKDDEPIISSPRKRTVRRSADKKHSRTTLSATDDTKSNTLTPDEPIQRTKSITDSIQTVNHSSHHNDNKSIKSQTLGSVGNLDTIDSDDDIDGTFEKVKSGLPNRASSYVDIRGSQLSINSILSDTKARYGLDISGTIELKLTYTLTTGALDVLINKCTNLARAKKHQPSDVYVKVYLLPDRSKNSKRKTAIKRNTTDPVFEEKFRYHVTKQEFETRILWISVWSLASLGHNDFLGEIHIPLANCTLDKAEEFQLLAKKNKHDLTPNLVPTMEPGEIQFQLTFAQNPKNKELGTLQINSIEGKALFYGKNNIDAICKGLLMPDNLKRKLPDVRKGPAPKWEVPLRWEGVRRDNLENLSIEVSIWNQERFRKTMLGFIRLNLAQGNFDGKPVKWLDSTNSEKSAWKTFLQHPTHVHHFRLPLRPAVIENK